MIINNKKIKLNRYSSGELKLKKNDLQFFENNNEVDIVFLQEESLFELFLVINYFKQNNIKVNLFLTYLPYQRMDKNNNKEIKTIDLVADIFNKLKLNYLYICEPHCDISKFENAKKVSLIDCIFEKIKKEICFDDKKDYLVFCDKGGKEKYCHLAKNSVYFEKQRNIETGLICSHKMVGKVPDNAKCVIIDDIISTGDTIKNCINMLNRKVYIVSGHYEKNKYNKLLITNEFVLKIFSSNSLIKKANRKLELLKCEDLLREINL